MAFYLLHNYMDFIEKDELIDMIKFTAIVQLLINITIVICGVYMLLK